MERETNVALLARPGPLHPPQTLDRRANARVRVGVRAMLDAARRGIGERSKQEEG